MQPRGPGEVSWGAGVSGGVPSRPPRALIPSPTLTRRIIVSDRTPQWQRGGARVTEDWSGHGAQAALADCTIPD
eukprot:129784-Hanusia_phi.AAC.1